MCGLKHPLISYDSEGLGDDTRLMQELGVSFDEGFESVFGHVGDQIVEQAALAEQGMGAGLDGVGLEIMPRLSPAAPSRVSRTTAKALSSSSLSRRCGSPMRTVERPKRRSLVSRKLGSTRHRFEYSAMICGAVASPLPVTRHQGSFMSLACTHTTAPTGHCAPVTVASRSLRARPPWPTHSAAGRVVPSAAPTLVLPFSRMT